MAKEYTVNLNKRQEFDIRLRRRSDHSIMLNERTRSFDVTVYSLPFSATFEAGSVVMVDSQIKDIFSVISDGTANGFVLDSNLSNTLCTVIERSESGIVLGDTDSLDVTKVGHIAAESSIVIRAGLTDLNYIAERRGESAFVVNVAPFGLETHFSVGSGESGVGIGATLGDVHLYKRISAENDIEFAFDVNSKTNYEIRPEESVTIIDVSAEVVGRRYRLLSDMNNNTLSEYDNHDLEGVDYIITN